MTNFLLFNTNSDKSEINLLVRSWKRKQTKMDLQAPLSNLSATQKDQLMTEVKQQIAVANAQELVTVSFKCYRKVFIILFWQKSYWPHFNCCPENYRKMLSEMCNKARHKLRRFRTKMYCNVYGSFYGLMESSLTNICAKNTTWTNWWRRFLSKQKMYHIKLALV